MLFIIHAAKKHRPPPRTGNGIPEITLKTPNKFKQFLVFVTRDILAKLSDKQYLVITLLEAPVLASVPCVHHPLF